MALLDRLLGDNKETSGTRVGTSETGGTRSRDEQKEELGVTQVGQIGSRASESEQRQEEQKEQTRRRQQEQESRTKQQQRNRGRTGETDTTTEESQKGGTRSGTQQQNTALERLLNSFAETQQQNKQKGSQRSTDVVNALGESSTVVENLDAAARDSLANLLQRFSGEGDALQSFVNLLEDRVGASQSRIAGQNADILAAAEKQGQRDIGASRTRLAAAAGGSTRNSLVEATASELENDLRLNLAGLEAQLTQQARAEEREEIDQVLRGFGTQGTVAQQVASALAQGKQVARTQDISQEQGHQTLESLVDSLTTSQETTQTRENAMNTLSSLSQEQLLDTIQNVRKQNRDVTTDNVLTGETIQQTQTEEAQFLSELAKALSHNSGREVSDQEILEVVERLTTDRSDEVFLNEGHVGEATSGKVSDDFNLRDVFGVISDLGSF